MNRHRIYSKASKLLFSKKNSRGLNVVDFGCGEGRLLDFLDTKSIKKYLGVDVNKSSITKAKKRYHTKRFSFRLISKSNYSFGKTKSVDAVFAIGVLQYLTKKERTMFFKKTYDALKKDGELILSTTTDHWIYQVANLYRFFLPHGHVNRSYLKTQLKEVGFRVIYERESGLFIAPLFSNVVVLFFDLLDKVFLGTKGSLGPIGTGIRKVFEPVSYFESKIPIDYGYTLLIKARK